MSEDRGDGARSIVGAEFLVRVLQVLADRVGRDAEKPADLGEVDGSLAFPEPVLDVVRASCADVAIDEATLTATRQFTCAEGGGFTPKVGPRKPSNALVYELGRTAGGSGTRNLRIKVGKRTRRIRLKVDANDAVGNQSAFAKTFRLG